MLPLSRINGKEDSCGDNSTLGIITVSDRASSGEYEDEGGPAILEFFEQALASSADVIYRCIPDDSIIIEQTLIELADEIGCDVISSVPPD